jgi:PAS domain S-box-containing protein
MPVLFGRETFEHKPKRVTKNNSNAQVIRNNELYENLLLMLSEINTGFLIIDAETKEFIFVNEAFCRICMLNTSEIFETSSLLSMIPENYLVKFNNEINETIKQNSTVRIFNTLITAKNNKKINVEVSARKLSRNSNKQVIMVIRDVSEKINKELLQKLMDEALHESEKRYRSSIEKVEDYAIFMLDYGGRVISWNTGAEKILGYTEKEIILKNFNIFFPETNKKESVLVSLQKNINKNGHSEKELELIKKSGKKFWGLVTITRLIKNNLSVIIRDLTRDKESEMRLHEQEIQLRSLAAHLQEARETERLRISRELHDEFSQVLTVLRMDLTVLSRMISKTSIDPVKRISLIEKITSISELLETAIRSTRRIITELRPAVLDELGLFTAMQWQAQEFENRTGIRCKIIQLQHNINLDKNTSTVIFRILQEGLTNVAKHSEATRVTISLTVRKNKLLLEIKDNGKGIGNDTLRAPTSTGLLGIRERVMVLNGNFEINSEEGHGTSLLVSVPYKED